MVNLGISVVTANISPDIKQRFIESIEKDSKPRISFMITFIDESQDIFTEYKGERFYNRNKAHNLGIKKLMPECEVILCSDVDFLIGENALDKTYKIGKKKPFFGIARFLGKNEKITPRKWNKWMNVKLHDAGYGGWIAMTPENWKRIGGWNESLFSWGYDKHIYHRVFNAGLIPERNGKLPIMHIHHKKRNKDIRKIDPNRIGNLGFENYLIS